eukprot:jgi/Mesen1/7252/ME000373S06318
MAAPSAAQVRSLYRRLLREGSKFSSYNVREYAKRRVKEAFRESQQVSDLAQKTELFAEGKKQLEVVKRQVIVYSLYAPSVKSIMDLKVLPPLHGRGRGSVQQAHTLSADRRRGGGGGGGGGGGAWRQAPEGEEYLGRGSEVFIRGEFDEAQGRASGGLQYQHQGRGRRPSRVEVSAYSQAGVGGGTSWESSGRGEVHMRRPAQPADGGGQWGRLAPEQERGSHGEGRETVAGSIPRGPRPEERITRQLAHAGRGPPTLTGQAASGRVVGAKNEEAEEEAADDAAIVGTCADMCPAGERAMRERLHDLAAFERLPGNPHRTSPALAVKKFSRTLTGSELQASEVRPLRVLSQTMAHLLSLVDSPAHPLGTIHEFVFDRTRAVRQELSMQRINGAGAIALYKPIVRFHILAAHELCEAAPGFVGGERFNAHLNMQQLSQALSSLLQLFDEVAARGAPCVEETEEEEEDEFFAYYILLNMGVRSQVLRSRPVQFAREAFLAYRLGNYRRFFQLAGRASYLEGALLHLHFPHVREHALLALHCGGYKAHPIALSDIADLLYMEDASEAGDWCRHLGLPVGGAPPALLVKEAALPGPLPAKARARPRRVSEKLLQKRGSSRLAVLTGEGREQALQQGLPTALEALALS